MTEFAPGGPFEEVAITNKSSLEEVRQTIIENGWPDFVLSEEGLLVPRKEELIWNDQEFFVDQAVNLACQEDINFSVTAIKGLYQYFTQGIKLARNFYAGLSEQLKNILQNELCVYNLFTDRTLNLKQIFHLSHSLNTISRSSIHPYDTFSLEQDNFYCRKSVIIGTVFSPFFRIEDSLDKPIIEDAKYNGEYISESTLCQYEKALATTVNKDIESVFRLTRELKRQILRR